MENKDSHIDVIFGLAMMAVVVFLIIYAGEQSLKNISVVMINYAYSAIQQSNILNSLIFPNQREAIISLYSSSRYVADPSLTFERISASLSLVQIPVAIFLFWRFRRYKRHTLPASYNYTIEGHHELFELKKDIQPSMYTGYLFGKAMETDLFAQAWGRYSMEYGVIRWSIYHELILHEGETLKFDAFAKQGLVVPDNLTQLSRYKERLDINLDKLAQKLEEQMGERYQGIDALKDYEIAIANLFLLFSQGVKGKPSALAYKRMLALSFKVTKPETGKEKITFKFNRKKGLKKLADLLKKADSPLINNSHYVKTFILSCYHHARSKNGDITPPDVLWLQAIDRPLYLLIHAYSGSPDRTINSPYIECVAPMSNWLTQFQAVKKSFENSATNSVGFIQPQHSWQTVFIKQLLSVKTNKLHNELIIDPSCIKSAFGVNLQKKLYSVLTNSNDIRVALEDIKGLKSLKLSVKEQRKVTEHCQSVTVISIKQQMFILALSVYDLLKDSIDNRSDISYARALEQFLCEIAWICHFDQVLYVQIASIIKLVAGKQCSCLKALQLLKDGKVTGFSEITHDHLSEIRDMSLDLTMPSDEGFKPDEVRILWREHSKSFMDSKLDGFMLANGLVEVMSHFDSIKPSPFTSHELLKMASTPSLAIKQSIKSIIYYLTDTEKWLKPQYEITLEKLIGTPGGEK